MQLKVILKFEKCFKRLNCLGNNFFIRNLQNINYQIKFALKISFFNSSHQSFFIWVIARRGNIRLGNCSSRDMSFGELSVGKLHVEEMSSGNCLLEKCLSGKSPSGK